MAVIQESMEAQSHLEAGCLGEIGFIMLSCYPRKTLMSLRHYLAVLPSFLDVADQHWRMRSGLDRLQSSDYISIKIIDL